MQQRLLGIAGSPRRNGNSEILLDLALGAAEGAGARVEKLVLSQLSVSPCRACDVCVSGRCIQRDDMDRLYPLLEAVDAILLATPVHFYGLPAQVKALVDRGQLFWHRKYGSGPPGPYSGYPRRGALIAVAATRGKQLFLGTKMTVRTWFDALDIQYAGELLVGGVDARGEIRGDAKALEDAAALGRALAAPAAPAAAGPAAQAPAPDGPSTPAR